MRAMWLTIPALLALAACGDPLAGVERVSEGATVPQDAASAALPSPDELARQDSILSGLFRRREPEAVKTDADVAVAEALGPETATRLDAPAPLEAEPVAIDPAPQPDAVVAEPVVEPVAAPQAAPKRAGLMGWLRRAADAERAAPTAEPTEAHVQTVALEDAAEQPDIIEKTDSVEIVPERVASAKRTGIFAGTRAAPRRGPDARDVPLGTILAFGEVARVCEAKSGNLGKLVDKGASKGRGYRLYDSAPNADTPRTFYVTGFADNCPRQFTGSLALFGSPEFHEQLRYGLPAQEYPYSTTDKAYEKVKSSVCNVGRNKPCGARITRLEKTTVFVSVYENFGENARWADMLLHDGAVLAKALKTP